MSIVEGYTFEPMVGDPDDHRPETRWALLVDPGGPEGRVDGFALITERIAPGDRIPLHVHRDDELVIVHGPGRYRPSGSHCPPRTPQSIPPSGKWSQYS